MRALGLTGNGAEGGEMKKNENFCPQKPYFRAGGTKLSFPLFIYSRKEGKLLRNNIQISASYEKISRNFLVLCAVYAFNFILFGCFRLVRCIREWSSERGKTSYSLFILNLLIHSLFSHSLTPPPLTTITNNTEPSI